MRKEYDFSKGIRNPYAARLRAQARQRVRPTAVEDVPPLTSAQIRKIRRELADLDDRTRYLLVSSFGPRFNLYYEISTDTYVMNEPARATLFKRRGAAMAIKRLLGKRIQIVRCRVDRRGQLVTSSLAPGGQRSKRKGAA